MGQRVYAIGNPFGLDHTLTSGIISGLNRELASGAGPSLRNMVQVWQGQGGFFCMRGVCKQARLSSGALAVIVLGQGCNHQPGLLPVLGLALGSCVQAGLFGVNPPQSPLPGAPPLTLLSSCQSLNPHSPCCRPTPALTQGTYPPF